jgi:pimeloyl-ACP methyl ester carboxylesterase
MRPLTSFFALFVFFASPLNAQSTLDPRHFKVEFEDERVRVSRLILEPGESTEETNLGERIMVTIRPTKLKVRFRASGMSVEEDAEAVAGGTQHTGADERISFENVGRTTWECVITEFKGRFAKTAAPAKQNEKQQERAKVEPPPAKPPARETVVPAPAQAVAQPKAEPQRDLQPPAKPSPTVEDAKSTPPEPTALNADGTKIAFLNGIELAYIERGSGPVVVLVHDTLGDYRSWAPQLAALSRNYRVIAYSRRYHYPNHSTGKERDYSYDINAKDLADFLKGLNVGPVRLVGFGYGATVAGMVAAEHPELVKGLVLTEPAYEQMLDKTMAFRSEFAREEIYGIIRKPLVKDKPEKGIQVYVDWQGYRSWAGMSTEEQFREKQNANALHAQTLDAAAPNFNCATAKKIIAPTLILSGQRRSPNSAEIAGVLSGCIANAERETVANAGAAVYLDNPQEGNKLLVEFLQKH